MPAQGPNLPAATLPHSHESAALAPPGTHGTLRQPIRNMPAKVPLKSVAPTTHVYTTIAQPLTRMTALVVLNLSKI
jgi:hypothetical protein